MCASEQNTISRTCLTCNKIIRGRSDKKFCNDYCRSAFNNKQLASKFKEIRIISRTLLKNRKVLQKWATTKTNPVNLQELLSDGLNLGYITQSIHQPLAHPLCYCYDYGYQLLPGNQCRILTPKNQKK